MLRIKPVEKPKPTWQVHARPIGASHEPWQTIKVEARSELQAEAILRRRGYEMALWTALRVAKPGELIPPATLQPLACARCGYGLVGLVIEEAAVICPECSYPQPLVAWGPAVDQTRSRLNVLIWVFAVIGMLATGLVLLIVLIAGIN
ncbi:MAG: hypothetical protein ACI89L_001762 [Phycisphaerales bacterium]|jgi:hypothetical protein